MKLLILPIGKTKSKAIAELASDYAGRLSHYLSLEVVPCRDEALLLTKLAPADWLVLLDARGKERSSEELAAWLEGQRRSARRRVALAIGGPDGAGEALCSRANELLALSRMTLPHELAQVVLLEQLYRAATILRAEPYHRGRA